MIKYFTGQELRWIDIHVIFGCLLHLCKSFFILQKAFIINFTARLIDYSIIVRNSGFSMFDTPPGGRASQLTQAEDS